ncbi:hypothetical protein EDC16_102109 [Testudinibacter aquarius]|uniref:Uncharacterized protein n=1 Tax=Testudinibacter aquarius TaxID=1524974 RepID=A0A4R3YBS1_9PAST|nr:hypothetical protein EDC16_102109 [Testudinibacter aquarius]
MNLNAVKLFTAVVQQGSLSPDIKLHILASNRKLDLLTDSIGLNQAMPATNTARPWVTAIRCDFTAAYSAP